jgi:hypothetical protein
MPINTTFAGFLYLKMALYLSPFASWQKNIVLLSHFISKQLYRCYFYTAIRNKAGQIRQFINLKKV